MVKTIGRNKHWPITKLHEYLSDNTVIYKTAYTKDELFAALWRAERKIKRNIVAEMVTVDMDSAIKEVLQEYWDSLGNECK